MACLTLEDSGKIRRYGVSEEVGLQGMGGMWYTYLLQREEKTDVKSTEDFVAALSQNRSRLARYHPHTR